MEEEQQDSVEISSADIGNPSDENMALPYALLHSTLGLVLLIVGWVESDLIARYSGFFFLGLAVLVGARPIQVWRRRRARRRMRKLARRQAKALRAKELSAQFTDDDTAVTETVEEPSLQVTSSSIVRTSVLHRMDRNSLAQKV